MFYSCDDMQYEPDDQVVITRAPAGRAGPRAVVTWGPAPHHVTEQAREGTAAAQQATETM